MGEEGDRQSRFLWQPGDLEKVAGPVKADPSLDVPEEILKALNSQNSIKVREALLRAFERFLQGYREWGGYRFYGWKSQEDQRNYRGPAVWSEADGVLRFARELEAEFPDQVHAEFNIANWTRSDYDKAKDGNQRIDLTLSDLSDFAEDANSQETFRTLTHWAFIEAKWFPKGWWGEAWGGLELEAQMASVVADANRLDRHLQLGRCLGAAILVVDDECFFHEHLDLEPDRVPRRPC